MERSRMACFPCFKPLSYSADSVIDKVSVHVERSEYGGLYYPLLRCRVTAKCVQNAGCLRRETCETRPVSCLLSLVLYHIQTDNENP